MKTVSNCDCLTTMEGTLVPPRLNIGEHVPNVP